MRHFFVGLVSLGAVGSFALGSGCNVGGVSLADLPAPDGGDEAGDATAPRGVGERCDDGGSCRPGLACTDGVCQPGRSSEQGAACVISAECKDGLYCGPERTCTPAGTGAEGAQCASDADCKSGFRCNLVGLDAQCQPEGDGDVGGVCAVSGDCFGGLFCAEKVCAPPPPGGPPPLGIPSFKGVPCETETGAVSAHFRVPRGQDDKDFFRLPYPNDVRRKNGRLDLTGFPTPGADLLGFDLVDRWARFLEQTATGYSVYPTVTFRFSGEIDFESLKLSGATRWVDVTDTEGGDLGYGWSGTTGRTAYVCPNNLSFRPRTGAPLKPGHTYAVMMTNLAKAKDGKAIVVSKDLSAILGATDPGGQLSAAYAAYAPLRTWAAAKAFNLGTVINAAVFTVGKTDDIARKLAPAVAAATAPAATSWVKCGAAASPCAQAADARACPQTENAAFDELHALVTLPLFQKGTLPFMEPADGGDLVLDGTGQPVPQGTAQVCMALTVPKGTMPAGGWPLVVYAHGTGGSFRSHVTEGVSTRLANVDGTTKIAVLGIDQVGHGTRRGASTAAPQTVFFNFTNPAAARGNVLQGAADQMALVRFAKGLTLAADASPTGAEIRFDRVAFWGHSQGATEGSIAMPYTPDVSGALFSGAGGSLIDSLLNKKSPVNLVALAPAILSEAPANVNGVHPALSMFQNAIDPADPLDHAAAIVGSGPLAKHVFVPYGRADTYSPPITQLTYVTAAGLAVAAHPASVTTPDDLLRAPVAVPVGGNAGGLTAVVRQYTPNAYDGHFVVFRDPDAKTNADRFLADAVNGVVPQLGR
ncbi:MAG: hypothetical protein KF795_27375 [Labilithrix sp.]|nr:hypothetical protein [Labilithrix sp.]